MTTPVQCPICLSPNGSGCVSWNEGKDATSFRCDICGEFEASGTALRSYLQPDYPNWSPVKRAAISHTIRSANDAGGRPPMLMTDWIEGQLIEGRAKLPSPAQQATNIIRYIGNYVSETGEALSHPPLSFYASVGAANWNAAMRLVRELMLRGHLSGIEAGSHDGPYDTINLDLSLSGWEVWEAERHGRVAGSHGFIALKFGDPELDPFLRDVIKPAVASLGYTLEDLRDAARAGVIDNVMRARIRDAAFVLVDLTHANAGAYWEAGFAEGLGKPVLYLCKKAIFDAQGTHFDTNHCTTVMWDAGDAEGFSQELIATLRRSLGLFSA